MSRTQPSILKVTPGPGTAALTHQLRTTAVSVVTSQTSLFPLLHAARVLPWIARLKSLESGDWRQQGHLCASGRTYYRHEITVSHGQADTTDDLDCANARAIVRAIEDDWP